MICSTLSTLGFASCVPDSDQTGEPPQQATLQSTADYCDAVQEVWVFEATTAGNWSLVPTIHMLYEAVEREHLLQLVSANPETNENRFDLELSIVPLDGDISGTQTTISCNDSVELRWSLPEGS